MIPADIQNIKTALFPEAEAIAGAKEWEKQAMKEWEEMHSAITKDCENMMKEVSHDLLVYDALDCDPRDGEDTYLSFPSFSDGEYTRRGA